MSVRTPSLTGPFCATAGADIAMSISVNPSDLRWTPRSDLPRDFIAFSPPNPARIDSPKRRGAEVKLLQINPEPPSDRRHPRLTRPGSRNPRCVRGAPGFYWAPPQLIGARSPQTGYPFRVRFLQDVGLEFAQGLRRRHGGTQRAAGKPESRIEPICREPLARAAPRDAGRRTVRTNRNRHAAYGASSDHGAAGSRSSAHARGGRRTADLRPG